MNEIKEKLDQLAEFHSQRDMITQEKQALIDKILTDEIKARVMEVETEFADKIDAVNVNIAALEKEIKQAVLEYGTSVKGSFFHAIYVKGRVSWNTEFLDGYAITHPEILSSRKEGEPSVSLRAIK